MLRAKTLKRKINWTSLKLKTFHAPKDTVNKVKNSPQKREKFFFANYILDEELVSGIYQELIQLNNKKM